MERSDAELTRRCLAGEASAWEEIVGRYQKRVYNLAYRYSGRFDEAEDLTQEIFFKVYRSLDAYRPGDGTFVAWLTRVGRNHIIDRYRKFRIERSRTDSLTGAFESVERNPARYAGPGEALERLETTEMVHSALLALPMESREAVILRDLEGFTYDEVARTLGVPLGTAKSRINRGRRELARVIRMRKDPQ